MDNAATGERKRGARLRDLFIMEECQGNRWYCLSMMHHTSSLSRAEMLETTRSLHALLAARQEHIRPMRECGSLFSLDIWPASRVDRDCFQHFSGCQLALFLVVPRNLYRIPSARIPTI